MSLYECRKDVDEWTSQWELQYWEPHEIMVRLMEEVGELAREVNHVYGPKKKKSTEEESEIADEVSDIIFTLCCLANSGGINLQTAWERMMNKLNKRDKERFEKKSDTNL